MEERKLYDIAEVCKKLHTTSRTLRFYEQKGIIRSTTVGISPRRLYTEEQLANVRNVIILRKLGLSVKTISELQANETDLKSAVRSRRAEIYASIDMHLKEITLLNDALSSLECGKTIYDKLSPSVALAESEEERIASICTNAVLDGNYNTIYPFLSEQLIKFMPMQVYEAARTDTFAQLGDYVSFDKAESDPKHPNRILHYLKFSKLGLKITYAFHNEKIYGLWLGYYNPNGKDNLC
ncbi:MAG: MerR family transcriptional regulator [Ruminococcaceae bacterium]|nr:MerR family transcriptional regulator [Oscillospiraceae bacterium]